MEGRRQGTPGVEYWGMVKLGTGGGKVTEWQVCSRDGAWKCARHAARDGGAV